MKNLIFDIGKVLVDFNYETVLQSINETIPSSQPKIDSKDLTVTNTFLQLHKGKISALEFYATFKENFHLSASYQEFIDILCSSFEPINEGIRVFNSFAFHTEVKRALLSDNHQPCEDWMRINTPDLFHADVLILSHRCGFVKPEKEIYKICLGELKAKPDACLLLDDRENNVEAARKLGIVAHLHTDWKSSAARIAKFINA